MRFAYRSTCKNSEIGICVCITFLTILRLYRRGTCFWKCNEQITRDYNLMFNFVNFKHFDILQSYSTYWVKNKIYIHRSMYLKLRKTLIAYIFQYMFQLHRVFTSWSYTHWRNRLSDKNESKQSTILFFLSLKPVVFSIYRIKKFFLLHIWLNNVISTTNIIVFSLDKTRNITLYFTLLARSWSL